MPFEKGHNLSVGIGRPKNEDSIRNRLRMFSEMSAEDLDNYRCKTTAEIIARNRIRSAILAGEDFRNIDALTEQLDGKPNQPQTIDAKVETVTNPIVDAIERDIAERKKENGSL
jgi:hypothetical protein